MLEQPFPGRATAPGTDAIEAKAIDAVTSMEAKGFLDRYFQISERGSTGRREALAGATTFMAMVYSVFVVPGMLGKRASMAAPCSSPPA